MNTFSSSTPICFPYLQTARNIVNNCEIIKRYLMCESLIFLWKGCSNFVWDQESNIRPLINRTNNAEAGLASSDDECPDNGNSPLLLISRRTCNKQTAVIQYHTRDTRCYAACRCVMSAYSRIHLMQLNMPLQSLTQITVIFGYLSAYVWQPVLGRWLNFK